MTILSGYTPVGVQPFGPLQVPVGARLVTLTIDRSELVDLVQSLAWSLELSVDAGHTWQGLGGAGLDLYRCGHDSPRFLDQSTQRPISGSRRGLLIVHGRRDGEPYTRWWAEMAGYGETIEPGYDEMNPDRRVRGAVTLAASCCVRGDVEFT